MNRSPSVSFALSFCLLLGVATTVLAQGSPRRARPIEFSEIKNDTVTTNLNQSPTRKFQLQQLNDQFKAPLSVLESTANRADLQPRLPAPTVNSRAIRKLLEKRDEDANWIFADPKEAAGRQLTPEAIFGMTEYDENGMVKKKKTTLEGFFDRLDKENLGSTNGVSRADYTDEKTDREIKSEARSLFGGQPFQAGPLADAIERAKSGIEVDARGSFLGDSQPNRGLSDFFSSGSSSAVIPQKSEAAISRRNDFIEMLDRKPAVSPGFNSLSPAAPASVRSPYLPPVSSPPSSPIWSSPAGGSPFGTPSASGSLYPTPPSAQPAKPSLPQPGFKIPNRNF